MSAKNFDVNKVDFGKIGTFREFINVLTKVARRHPEQAGKLLDKYVDFLTDKNKSSTREETRIMAVENIRFMAMHYEKKLSDLLIKRFCAQQQ